MSLEMARSRLIDAGAETVVLLPETGRLMVWVRPDRLAEVKSGVRASRLVQVSRETEQPKTGELYFTAEMRGAV